MNKYSEIEYIQNNPFCSEWKTAAEGQYKGYTFAIMYNGVNPCAYIMLPQSHILYKSLCKLVAISEHRGIGTAMDTSEYALLNNICCCHGDITWVGKEQNNISGAWFGWDYMHYPMDYNGYLQSGHKKWTVAGIYNEIQVVITNLVQFDKNSEK